MLGDYGWPHLHLAGLAKLGEEVGLQLVAQMVCKTAAAVDAEGDRQRQAQCFQELLPLALWHDRIAGVVLLKVGVVLLVIRDPAWSRGRVVCEQKDVHTRFSTADMTGFFRVH